MNAGGISRNLEITILLVEYYLGGGHSGMCSGGGELAYNLRISCLQTLDPIIDRHARNDIPIKEHRTNRFGTLANTIRGYSLDSYSITWPEFVIR
jgi:hypothetical protein